MWGVTSQISNPKTKGGDYDPTSGAGQTKDSVIKVRPPKVSPNSEKVIRELTSRVLTGLPLHGHPLNRITKHRGLMGWQTSRGLRGLLFSPANIFQYLELEVVA